MVQKHCSCALSTWFSQSISTTVHIAYCRMVPTVVSFIYLGKIQSLLLRVEGSLLGQILTLQVSIWDPTAIWTSFWLPTLFSSDTPKCSNHSSAQRINVMWFWEDYFLSLCVYLCTGLFIGSTHCLKRNYLSFMVGQPLPKHLLISKKQCYSEALKSDLKRSWLILLCNVLAKELNWK